MPAYSTVIFDLDGVLVDSIAAMKETFEAAHDEVVGDGRADFAEFKRYLGHDLQQILDTLGLPAAMHDAFVRQSSARVGSLQPFDGIVDLLEALERAGVRMGVATGKSGPRAHEVLDALGLTGYFSLIVGSDDVAHPKPAPDMILAHLQNPACPPSQAIAVGDAVSDLRAARGAGVAAAAALWGNPDPGPLLAEQPDHVLRHPDELRSLLAI